MMAHLLDALESGTDVGHYGRLVFAMVARHCLDDNHDYRIEDGHGQYVEQLNAVRGDTTHGGDTEERSHQQS